MKISIQVKQLRAKVKANGTLDPETQEHCLDWCRELLNSAKEAEEILEQPRASNAFKAKATEKLSRIEDAIWEIKEMVYEVY